MGFIQQHFSISECIDNQASARSEQLVAAAKAGSHSAFSELQKLYSGRLYKRIISITRSHEDAEDVLQDTFLRAYQALPSFQGRSQFSTWLTRIAINSALMAIRRERSRPKASLDLQFGPGDDAYAFDVCDNALNPEQVCDQKQQVRMILNAVERLDPKLRTPIHILIDEKRSMRELAHRLRISVASVKARLHRARKRLRDPIAQRRIRADLVSHFRYSESHEIRAPRLGSLHTREEAYGD